MKKYSKKSAADKFLLKIALGVIGLTALACIAEYKWVKQPVPKVKSINKKEKLSTSLDITYNYISEANSAFFSRLHYGTSNGLPCVKIGYNVPIFYNQLINLPFDKNDPKMADFLENAEKIYFDVLDKKGIDNHELPNEVIRPYTKNFLADREIYYQELCQKHGFDYKDVPYKGRAALFLADRITGFQNDESDKPHGIGTCKELLKAIGRQDWKKAEEEIDISEETIQKYNPFLSKPDIVNLKQSIKNLFKSLYEEQQKWENIQKRLKQQGKYL